MYKLKWGSSYEVLFFILSSTSQQFIHPCFAILLLDMMETYRAAIERRVAAEEELQEQVSAQNTPEMVAKVNECKEAERQLKSIEERLGMLQ